MFYVHFKRTCIPELLGAMLNIYWLIFLFIVLWKSYISLKFCVHLSISCQERCITHYDYIFVPFPHITVTFSFMYFEIVIRYTLIYIFLYFSGELTFIVVEYTYTNDFCLKVYSININISTAFFQCLNGVSFLILLHSATLISQQISFWRTDFQ